MAESLWDPAERKVRQLRLMQKALNSIYSRLMVRYPHQKDSDYAYFYFDAAERLGNTFDGANEDDTILIPVLMLYGHGFELELKSFIKELIRLRQIYLGHDGPDATPEDTSNRLRTEVSTAYPHS